MKITLFIQLSEDFYDSGFIILSLYQVQVVTELLTQARDQTLQFGPKWSEIDVRRRRSARNLV